MRRRFLPGLVAALSLSAVFGAQAASLMTQSLLSTPACKNTHGQEVRYEAVSGDALERRGAFLASADVEGALIQYDQERLPRMPEQAQFFVLAHDCSHIARAHSARTFSPNLTRETAAITLKSYQDTEDEADGDAVRRGLEKGFTRKDFDIIVQAIGKEMQAKGINAGAAERRLARILRHVPQGETAMPQTGASRFDIAPFPVCADSKGRAIVFEASSTQSLAQSGHFLAKAAARTTRIQYAADGLKYLHPFAQYFVLSAECARHERDLFAQPLPQGKKVKSADVQKFRNEQMKEELADCLAARKTQADLKLDQKGFETIAYSVRLFMRDAKLPEYIIEQKIHSMMECSPNHQPH